MTRIFNVSTNPTNIFTPKQSIINRYTFVMDNAIPSKTPLPQTHPPHIQPLGTTAPQKHETPLRRYLPDIQIHDLIPRPELHVRHAHRPLVFLQRRLDQDHVEFTVQVFEVVVHQVAL